MNPAEFVLVIDEDKKDVELLSAAMSACGHRVPVVHRSSEQEAIDFLLALDRSNEPPVHWPFLVLLDPKMPSDGGLQVLRTVKQHPVLRSLPVIVFTSLNEPDRIRCCYEAGANAYVLKPIGFDKLRSTVDALCKFWHGTNVR
jgi:CheY-like chemotaxis protein